MEDKLYIVNPPKKYRTVNNFLKFFFDSYTKATFNDPKCNSMHCPRARQRSMNDIYRLVKTYYKSISRKRFAEIFKKFIYENNIKGRYCGTTKAIVFSKGNYGINRDKTYPFLYKLDTLAHHSLTKIKSDGFTNEIYNLENLNKLLK